MLVKSAMFHPTRGVEVLLLRSRWRKTRRVQLSAEGLAWAIHDRNTALGENGSQRMPILVLSNPAVVGLIVEGTEDSSSESEPLSSENTTL
jgi:hypothetical protein